jgi:hypothetical protein
MFPIKPEHGTSKKLGTHTQIHKLFATIGKGVKKEAWDSRIR